MGGKIIQRAALSTKTFSSNKPEKTKYNFFQDLHDDFLLTASKIVKFPRLTFTKDILICGQIRFLFSSHL